MKWTTLLILAIALAAVVGLVRANDMEAIGRTLIEARWGVLAVLVAHLPATFFAAVAWHEMITGRVRPGVLSLFKIRWIKESVNSLLPVAQIGGEVVRARLAMREGVELRTVAASCTVDVAAGMMGLFAYTALGLGFFLLVPHDSQMAGIAGRAIIAGGAIAAAVALALRMGLMRIVETGLQKLASGGSWGRLGEIEGLNASVIALFHQPRRLALCTVWHLVAWAAGVIETCVILMVVGAEPSLTEAFVIDSLGQGVRAAGFAVPGALGVQEGGYILVCGLFGIPPEKALALSFMRRIREFGLGVPGLIAWARIERWSPKRHFRPRRHRP